MFSRFSPSGFASENAQVSVGYPLNHHPWLTVMVCHGCFPFCHCFVATSLMFEGADFCREPSMSTAGLRRLPTLSQPTVLRLWNTNKTVHVIQILYNDCATCDKQNLRIHHQQIEWIILTNWYSYDSYRLAIVGRDYPNC